MPRTPEFIEDFLKGNTQVLNLIYKELYPKVKTYILKNSGTVKDAEDVFQNALLILLVKIKENPGAVNSFDSYLFTVCRNYWRRERQKKRVTNLDYTTLNSKESDLAGFYVEQTKYDLFREKLAELSEQCKELLGMSFAKVPYSEIVKAFGYASQLVARQRVFKCRSRLIKLIKKDPRAKGL